MSSTLKSCGIWRTAPRYAATVCLAWFCAVSQAHETPFWLERISVAADFRTRLETDFNSQNAAGVERDDRTRLRIRARLGAAFETDGFSLGLRVRSGSDDSQQSPHITIADFDGNDTGDADFNLDRWYFSAHHDGWRATVGRMSLPLWKQNELLWDDDVTPAGVAAGRDIGNWKFDAGYFSLPVGMQDFSGNLAAGQILWSGSIGNWRVTGAGGIYVFDAESNDPDAARLLSGNGFRDYTIWNPSIQLRNRAFGQPVTFGAELFYNGEDYGPEEPARDEDTGFVISARLGGTDQPGDWLAGYYYARIEELSVNNSFAQDDWVRWGSATQTRASNFEGHELRFAMGLVKGLNIVARLYLVDAITTVEDGNRFRIDLNYSF